MTRTSGWTEGRCLAVVVVATFCGLSSCAPWGHRSSASAELSGAMDELVQLVARLEGDEEVAVLGFRDEEGERTTATEILDEHLISALLQARVPLVLVDGAGKSKWGKEQAVPASQFEDLSTSRVLAGRLQNQANWAYLRLFVIERESATLMGMDTRRLVASSLLQQVEQRSRREEKASGPVLIEADLYLLGLRREGGFDQWIEIKEKDVLQPGDRLQIRFKVSVDCQVYAFLYSSEGEVKEVFASQSVYGGRMQYGPGEETWVTVGESGKVQTLYFIATSRLDEDKGEMFESMGKLIEDGEVDRFRGLEKLDQAVAAFLLARLESSLETGVVRNLEQDRFGAWETFILEDGTPIESQVEKLGPEPVLVRAFSFAVQ